MELRHLRYFLAVAEAGSLKLAAEEKLHTTQPSLSRQIRDLEHEVGAVLFLRSSRGVELTAAGRVLLDHARVMLSQAETAVQSVRQAVNPAKPTFTMGFMIGHDSTWLPKALQILQDELPRIHVVISTQNSPQLAAALSQGLIDVAFLRREDGGPALDYIHLTDEALEVYLPRDHRLSNKASIDLRDIVGETFLNISGNAMIASGRPPALRMVIDRYLESSGIDVRSSHEVDNLGGIMSLITSTRGVALLPAYARTFLPATITTRPLQGAPPKIDVSVGFRKANRSPILEQFLSKVGKLAQPPANDERKSLIAT